MIRIVLLALTIPAMLAMAACETVEGAGRDIENAGESVSDAARDAGS